MAWDDEITEETQAPEMVKLVGANGSVPSVMTLTVVQENNSWRIKVEVHTEGHPTQEMVLDGWYPSKFAAAQDLPMVANAAKGKGWVTSQ